MKAKIAVATVSGKAYYRLVNELKQKRVFFLSLVPGEPIAPSIKAVITTEKEKSLLNHPNIIIYDPETEPSDAVNEAVRMIRNKEIYDEVTIGVDPGKTFGVAILGDGVILKTEDGLSLEKTVDTILTGLKKNPGKVLRVKIGSGIPELAEELFRRLKIALPDNVAIEIVSEAGTSSLKTKGVQRKISDADSAAKIAAEKGNAQFRRKIP
ncbi:MAG: hypothetical protein QXX08_04445 [Candidatus Bathyarchaeia archaeon]